MRQIEMKCWQRPIAPVYWYYRLIGIMVDLPFLKRKRYVASGWISRPTACGPFWIRFSLIWNCRAIHAVSAAPGIPTKGAGDHLLTKIYLANIEFDKAIEAATRVNDGPYSLMTERFGVEAEIRPKM